MAQSSQPERRASLNVLIALLAISLQGVFLAHAVKAPDEEPRWVLYLVALVFAVVVIVISMRRASAAAREFRQRERSAEGARTRSTVDDRKN